MDSISIEFKVENFCNIQKFVQKLVVSFYFTVKIKDKYKATPNSVHHHTEETSSLCQIIVHKGNQTQQLKRNQLLLLKSELGKFSFASECLEFLCNLKEGRIEKIIIIIIRAPLGLHHDTESTVRIEVYKDFKKSDYKLFKILQLQ